MAKILVIEDVKAIRESLVSFLLSQDFSVNDAGSSDEARVLLKEFEPDVVLLDLKIPRNTTDGVESIRNAVDVLQDIQFLNVTENLQIKVIIISGTIDDPGIQQLVYGDRSNIINFINKNESATDTSAFQAKLLKNIEKAIKKDIEPKSIEYKALRRSLVRELKAYNVELHSKIESDVLNEFEKLNEKGTNLHRKSKDVVISCGEIVEDIISLIENEGTEISTIEYQDNPFTVRNRLNALTGRIFSREDGYKPTGEEPKISRPASECAFQAYNLRSEAVHGGKETDEQYRKIYANKYRFTREDAAVSVNLIMPLIRDYIEYLKDNKS